MKIWLASYPRSGNSLLSTIIYQCLGIGTYANYKIEPERHSPELSAITGQYGLADTARDLLDAGGQLLVKTHDHPSDDEPFIYIVREGRQAISSLLKFERAINSNHDCSMLQLILGDTYFGSWSNHYIQWHKSPERKRLTLRFEELIDPDLTVINKIADFIGHEGERKPFINPFAKLAQIEPRLYETGSSVWNPMPEWTPQCDYAFWAVHGHVMKELGYGEDLPSLTLADTTKLLTELLNHSTRLAVHRNTLERTCVEKEDAIRLLSGAADERAKLIERLSEEHKMVAELKAQRQHHQTNDGSLLTRLYRRAATLAEKLISG